MTYLEERRRPWASLPGLFAVIVFHLALIAALVNGLGSAFIEKARPDMITKVLDEVKPPPPPPPPPEPQVMAPQTPDFIPQPEIIVRSPPKTSNAPAQFSRSPAPAVKASAAPPAPPVPDEAFSPAHIVGGLPAPVYPDAYNDSGRTGQVKVDCTIETDGRPTHCRVVNERGGSAFATAVLQWLNGGNPPVYRPAIRGGKKQAEDHEWVVSFQAPE